MKRIMRRAAAMACTAAIAMLILPVSLLLLLIRFIWNAIDKLLEEKGEAK
ncbi:MAG: hypothetical protein NC120_07770 [Ruminococcus sp.]|nr:hypothetical protein [Ruminococcus sp.]